MFLSSIKCTCLLIRILVTRLLETFPRTYAICDQAQVVKLLVFGHPYLSNCSAEYSDDDGELDR